MKKIDFNGLMKYLKCYARDIGCIDCEYKSGCNIIINTEELVNQINSLNNPKRARR